MFIICGSLSLDFYHLFRNSKSLIINATKELEEAYNMLRISLAPQSGDAISIHEDPEDLFSFSAEVVGKAKEKVDAAFEVFLSLSIFSYSPYPHFVSSSRCCLPRIDNYNPFL